MAYLWLALFIACLVGMSWEAHKTYPAPDGWGAGSEYPMLGYLVGGVVSVIGLMGTVMLRVLFE